MGVAGVLAKEAKGARCGSGCGEKREGGHVGRHLVLVGLEKKRKKRTRLVLPSVGKVGRRPYGPPQDFEVYMCPVRELCSINGDG
jgi:hypothetical protein